MVGWRAMMTMRGATTEEPALSQQQFHSQSWCRSILLRLLMMTALQKCWEKSSFPPLDVWGCWLELDLSWWWVRCWLVQLLMEPLKWWVH